MEENLKKDTQPDFYKYKLTDNVKYYSSAGPSRDFMVNYISNNLKSSLLFINSSISGKILDEKQSLIKINKDIIASYKAYRSESEEAESERNELIKESLPEVIEELKKAVANRLIERRNWEPVLARYFMMVRDYLDLFEKSSER